MDELQTILASHRTKKSSDRPDSSEGQISQEGPSSEIPDVFFDKILVNFKINRIEIMVLMYLYRHVWCRPNLYREHGISQILSHSEMAKSLRIALEEVYNALRKLEEFGLISTVRSGQYFVRRYFSKEFDDLHGQTYDDFQI